MDNLLLGLLSAALAGGLFNLRERRRRSRLKQQWASQSDQQREQYQQEQLRNQALQQQLDEQQQQLEQQLRLGEQWSQERDAARQELQTFLESFDSSNQERTIQAQRETIQSLEAEQIRLGDRLTSLEAELTAAQAKLDRDRGIETEQFGQLINLLLPNLSFLRDSMAVMLALDPPRLQDVLGTLKALNDGTLGDTRQGQAVKIVKVRATHNEWSECRVPHVSMMRIYFHKTKQQDGYQVLVSPKKDQKTQDKDYEWLKSQTLG